MTLPQATPGLLSLNIKRTAESITSLDTRIGGAIIPVAPAETEADHAEEKQKIFALLEQQCFAFTALRNQVRDSRRRQARLVGQFRDSASEIEEKLSALSRSLLHRVDTLSERISGLSEVVSPKPLFERLVQLEGAGRITGITSCGSYLSMTSALGRLLTVERTSGKVVSCVMPFEGEGMRQPRLLQGRSGKLVSLGLSSRGRLAICTPLDSAASRCIGEGIECFDCVVAPDGVWSVVCGRVGCIEFSTLNGDDGCVLTTVGKFSDVHGAVRHILCDSSNHLVYAASARRRLYSVSSKSFELVASRQMEAFVLEMQLTQLFLVVSVAPQEVLFVERGSDKLSVLMKVTIAAGLRCFACSGHCLFVLTKEQTVERRPLGHIENMELICDLDASDCDEDLHIGLVYVDGLGIYLAQDGALSIWR